MAIEITEFKTPWVAADAAAYIRSETDKFGVFFDMDRCYEYIGLLRLENTKLDAKARQLTHNAVLSLNNKTTIINTLRDMGVSGSDFKDYSGKVSYDAKVQDKILRFAGYSDDIKELVQMSAKYKSNMRNAGYLRNLCALPNCIDLSKLNHRMTLGNPKWNVLNTSRISASDPGVQGVPRSMGDIICEPKGYTLVRADSGQIEPRINFSYFLRDELIMNLITYYKDAYFGIMHYCLMDDETEQLCRQDFQAYFRPTEITDEIKDLRQSIKRLTNAGSYGSTHLDGIVPQLASAYERKIVKHPKRLELERKVEQQVRRGDNTFFGAFGTPVTPGATEKYSVGDEGWHEHVVRCGINNPVQTTASELMLWSVWTAREILSRAKDSHICFYKHDEACFYVSDADMEAGIGEELAHVTAYNVKGWIPIESDVMYGIKHSDTVSYL